MNLLTVPTWELLTILEKLNDRIRDTDIELDLLLRSAAYALHACINDNIRLGHITEEKYNKQKRLARYYALKNR